ncbi:12886_t:CDS:1, partial [Racocetra persica]
LYKVMHQQTLTDMEIDKFEDDVKQWIKDFTQPTIGKLNSSNQ